MVISPTMRRICWKPDQLLYAVSRNKCGTAWYILSHKFSIEDTYTVSPFAWLFLEHDFLRAFHDGSLYKKTAFLAVFYHHEKIVRGVRSGQAATTLLQNRHDRSYCMYQLPLMRCSPRPHEIARNSLRRSFSGVGDSFAG